MKRTAIDTCFIPKNTPLYFFEELAPEAQAHAAYDKIDAELADEMSMQLDYYENSEFGNSSPELDYDFGIINAGCNIYGKLEINDLAYMALGYYLPNDAKALYPAYSHKWHTGEWWSTREYYEITLDAVYEAHDAYYTETSLKADRAYENEADEICRFMSNFCAEMFANGEAWIDECFEAPAHEDVLFLESGEMFCSVWDIDAYNDEETAA